MRPLFTLVSLALLTAALAGCSHTGTDADRAAINTTHGCILVEFYSDEAPNTVENFVQYAEDGFYEGTIFHRIIPGFMIQGGGFTEAGQQQQPRDPIALEYDVPNERGNVAMARTGDPDSATSQFFVNTVDNSQNLGPGGADQYGYTVFARVVEGMDVVDAIAQEPTGTGPGGQQNWPQDPPVIEGVDLEGECGGSEPEEPAPSEATEYLPFWVLNTGEQNATFHLDIEGPEGWNVSLETDALDLSAAGQGGDAGTSYIVLRDYGPLDDDGLIRLSVNSSAGAESFLVLEIQPAFEVPEGPWEDSGATEGPDVEAGLITNTQQEDGVWESFLSSEPVSAPGKSVTIAYAGSFDDGEEFDSGSFPTVVGSGQTVAGFDTGLLGLEVAETVDIRFPPEAGYGYNPGPRHEQFAGEWLNFEITLESMD